MTKKNYNIKSVKAYASNSPVNLGIGAVAAGMTRYVTFVKVTNETAGANALYICSGTTATDAASGVAKDKQAFLNQYDILGWPDMPNPDLPLFSIAANKYLSVIASSAGKMYVFMQYYDE